MRSVDDCSEHEDDAVHRIHLLTGLLIPALLPTAAATAAEIDEIKVLGARDKQILVADDTLVAPADSGELLQRLPGANVNQNGALTGIPQYRGMFGNRINVSVDGTHISSGGPNAMDTPLHYAPVALLESVTVHRGVTPVSIGQETLGGSIATELHHGDFGASDRFQLQGRSYLGTQSAREGGVGSLFAALANRHHLLRVFGLHEQADDGEFSDGHIRPSEYQRNRYDIGYGFARGPHEWSIDYARNETGDAGTPALPMDIEWVDSDLYRTRYQWQGQGTRIEASLAYSDISHGMSNFHLRRPPLDRTGSPNRMRFRHTGAEGESIDASLKVTQQLTLGTLRYGIDAHLADHDASIRNPSAAAFLIENFRHVERDVLGGYLELNTALNARLELRSGVRLNQVRSDAGTVTANLNPMAAPGMPATMDALAGVLADRFNASDRSQRDRYLDAFARLSLQARPGQIWYLGMARKHRAPSYQERYLWLPMESTGGLADGFTYVGDPELSPERSHELELGVDLEHDRWSVYPRLFFKHVDDYIQGRSASEPTTLNFARMMANMGMGQGEPLQFSNTEARFFGMDLEANIQLAPHWRLHLIGSLVRGERRDIDDDLYRVAPDNLRAAVEYQSADWLARLEWVVYAAQSRVSATQNESTTSGYQLLNLGLRRQLGGGAELHLGVDNLLDRDHRPHLAGYNRAFNPDVERGERLPGIGRNGYARLLWAF